MHLAVDPFDDFSEFSNPANDSYLNSIDPARVEADFITVLRFDVTGNY
jgi:hypothetical protein